MANTLNFVQTGENSQLLASLAQSKAALEQVTAAADMTGQTIDNAISGFKSMAIGAASFAGLATGSMSLINQIKEIRTEFQNTEAMFKVFLKSGEAAEAFMQRMQAYAFNNVFDLSRLSQSAAQLLAYGTNVDVVIDKLDNLSNIAAGTNKPLEDLVGVYNKVKSTDIIDSRTEASLKNMGINVRELVEQAKELDKGSMSGVTLRFKDLDMAIQAATHDGGLYEGMMEEKMKTLGDKVGLLQDQLQNTLNDIGKDIQEPFGETIENLADILEDIKEPLSAVVKAGVDGAKFVTENWKGIVTILATVAAQYGTLKAAMAMEKAYNNTVRMNMHKAECAQLEKLRMEYLKLQETQLKQEVSKLRNSGDDSSIEELQLLNQKEQELIKLRTEIGQAEIDNSLSAKEKYDILNRSYAEYAQGLETYVNASGRLTAKVIENKDAELNAIDDELAGMIKKDGAMDENMAKAFEELELNKMIQKEAEDKIVSINGEMNSLQELIKVRESQGLGTEVERNMLATKSIQLRTATQEHATAVQDVANARTQIYTATETANTVSTQTNTLAKKANTTQTQLSKIQTEGATLSMKASTAWTYAQTAALKVGKLAIMSVKAAWVSLKASMATNPMGWIFLAIEGLVSLGMWMARVFKKDNPAEEQQKALTEAIAGAQAQAQQEQWDLDVLIKRMQEAGKGTEEYAKLRLQLINQYGKYGEFVRDETDAIVEQGEAYNLLSQYIENAAMARARDAWKQDQQNELNEASKKVFNEIAENKEFQVITEVDNGMGQKYNQIVDADEETAKKIQAHWMRFFQNELPKMAESGAELSALDIEKRFQESFEKEYNIKVYAVGKGSDDIAEQMEDWLDEQGERWRQLYGGKSGEFENIGATKGEDNKPDPKTIEDQKQLYLKAMADVAEAQKIYSQDGSEENKKTFDTARQTADNYFKDLKAMMGSVDNTLTLDMAQQQSEEQARKIGELYQQINDARRGIVNGKEVDEETAQTTLANLQAQLTVEEQRQTVIKNTIAEIMKDPTATYMIELSTDEIAKKRNELQKEIDALQLKVKLNPTVEDITKLGAKKDEAKTLENAWMSRTGATTNPWSNKTKTKNENTAKKAANEEARIQREINKAVTDAANERIKIENSRIQAQRVARKAEFDLEVKRIKEESKAWSDAHKGRVNAAFAKKIENLKLKFEIDTENAEKQFREWKRNFERETIHMRIDMETAALQQQINLEDDVTKRIELQNRLFERQVELRREDMDLERDQYVKQQYGDKTLKDYQSWASKGDNKELLSRYAQSSGKEREDIVKSSGLSEELLATYAEMEQIFEQYENRYQQTVLQMTQEKGFNDFNAEAERLQAFYDEVERINQEHNERVLQLQREGGTKAEFDQAKELRDQQLAQAGQQLGANDKAGLMGRFTNFANDIAGLTYEEIKKQYTDFFDILQGDIKNVGNEVEVLKKYDTEEDIQQRANTIGQQLESGTKEDGTQLTPDEEIALLDEKVLLEQTLADIKANQGNKAALLNQKELELTTLKKGQVKATQTYTNAIAKAETKEQRAKRLLTQGLDATKEGLGAVKDATNAVADAFGGALSKKAKKALDTISDIADFAMQSIDGIKFVSENANKLMATTAETAAESVSTVEKASVILTIISLAVQAIMAIIKIASKFTESAKMQEQIDEYKEQVEDLKKEQERLEKAYKREVGSDYYKGMAKAAEKYNEVVQKNNQAIAEAAKLYEYQKAKYGEDSDKAKDAKAQLDELKDAGEDYADSQKEIYDELAESLLGTNVTSFADGLADSLVSAWQEGTTDMTDIWDTMLDDMKRDMMKKALSIALTDMFEKTFDNIGKLAEEGSLDQAAIDQAIAEIDAKSAQAEAIAEQWRRAMEERGLLDDANPEADAGGFGSMSQDTADELNARFTALQMEGAAVVLATTAMQESMSLMQANSDRSLLLIQDIDRFQQLAYEQAQEHIDLIRAISDNVLAISKDTARLKAIEQNTDRL